MGNKVVHSVETPAGSTPVMGDRVTLAVQMGIVNAAGANPGAEVTTVVAMAGLPPNYAVAVSPSSGLRFAVNGKTATGFNVDLYPSYPPFAAPGAPTATPTGTTGATSYSYTVAALDGNGGVTAASAAGSTSTGNATLSGTNYNALSVTAVPGAVQYAWYRTVGGATQGLIGVTTAPTLNDTGLAATTSAGVPSASPAAATATVPAGTFDVIVSA